MTMITNSIENKVLLLLGSRTRKTAKVLSQASVCFGLLAGWIALEGSGRLLFIDTMSPDAPLRKHPEVVAIAWLLLCLCIYGSRWSKRVLHEIGLEISLILRGVKVEDIIVLAADKSSSKVMAEIVSFLEDDPLLVSIGYAAIKNWEDGPEKVYRSLLSSSEVIHLIVSQSSKGSTQVATHYILLSFSPIIMALGLGCAMVASPVMILDKMLGQLVFYLFVAGILLPIIVFSIPMFQAEKSHKEMNYIKRLSTQQVAWMGVIWGDYAVRELMFRKKDGDTTVKQLIKTLNQRRAE